MKFVLFGLGSNREHNGKSSLELLGCACRELSKILKNPIFSSVYITKAMYVTDQSDFYNMCAAGYVADDTNPYELLKNINKIEAKYGRDRSKEIRFGPRSLDIDIEAFGEDTIQTEILTVPHPRLKERAFVLVPALEILTNSADTNKREVFEKWINDLPEQDKALEVVVPASDIISL